MIFTTRLFSDILSPLTELKISYAIKHAVTEEHKKHVQEEENRIVKIIGKIYLLLLRFLMNASNNCSMKICLHCKFPSSTFVKASQSPHIPKECIAGYTFLLKKATT